MLDAMYENRRHSTPEIPYSLYPCEISESVLYVPLHWHQELEIDLIAEGSSLFRVRDEEFPVAAGDIVFIQPNLLHSIHPDENHHQVYDAAVIDERMLDRGTPTRSGQIADRLGTGELCVDAHIARDSAGYAEIHRCAAQLIEHMRANTAEDDLLVKSRLLELIYLLARHGHIRAGAEQDSLSVLKPALLYISEHYRENISVAQLARLSFLSESYFMLLFKRYIGHTAVEHIIKLRLEEACRMLRSTDRSVTEIAGLCGFANISNFNRHFRKSAGVSPKEYRRKFRN